MSLSQQVPAQWLTHITTLGEIMKRIKPVVTADSGPVHGHITLLPYSTKGDSE